MQNKITNNILTAAERLQLSYESVCDYQISTEEEVDGTAGWTHHSSLGLSIVQMGVEQHSCVIVRCLQCNGKSIAAILQTEEEMVKVRLLTLKTPMFLPRTESFTV